MTSCFSVSTRTIRAMKALEEADSFFGIRSVGARTSPCGVLESRIQTDIGFTSHQSMKPSLVPSILTKNRIYPSQFIVGMLS